MKANVIAEIKANPVCYAKAGHVMLIMKGTTFKKWLDSMKRPRTQPDELMLYALCVLYRRHCIVYTKWQPWHSVNPTAGQTFNMIEEMCETKLLYIGENLFGVLRRLPLDRPITPPIVLSDVQNARLIDRDISENIHLTITGLTRQAAATSSNMAQLPSVPTSSTHGEDEKIIDIKPIKTDPEGTIPFNMFGDAYADFLTTAQEEPGATVPEGTNHPPELHITEVQTLGTYIKPETVTCGSTACSIDLDCTLHGVHSHASHTLQEAMPTLPEATLTPLGKSTASNTQESDTLQDATIPVAQSTCMDVHSHASYTPQEAPPTLPEATLTPSNEATAFNAQELDTLQDATIPIVQSSSTDVLQVATEGTDILQEPTPDNKHITATASNTSNALPEATTSYEITIQPVLPEAMQKEPMSATKYYACLTSTEDDILYLHYEDIVNTSICTMKTS